MAHISSANWSGQKKLKIKGSDFKENPDPEDVEVQAPPIFGTETAVTANGTGTTYNATTANIGKGDKGAQVRVRGSNGLWSSYKTIS